MKFSIQWTDDEINGVIVYRPAEYSFDTEGVTGTSFSSVTFKDLILEIDAVGLVVAIRGMCPHTSWMRQALKNPKAKKGRLRVLGYGELKRGVSYSISNGDNCSIFWDESVSWVCLDTNEVVADSIEVFSGAIVDLTPDGKVARIWLKSDGQSL